MLRTITGLTVAILCLWGTSALGERNYLRVADKSGKTASSKELSPYLPDPGDRRETAQLNRACKNIQNTHECAQAVEKMQLPRYPQLVSRQGGTLRLTLKSGGAVELKDVDQGNEKNTFYSFREFFQDLGYYLVEVSYWEGGAHLMVNYQTGKRYLLHDLFLLAPDRQRLATVVRAEAYGPTAIQIWRISPEKMTREYSIEPKDWGPQDGAWLNNETLTFVKTSNYGVRLGKMLVQKGPAGWKLLPQKP